MTLDRKELIGYRKLPKFKELFMNDPPLGLEACDELENWISDYVNNEVKAVLERVDKELIGEDEEVVVLVKSPETEFLREEKPSSQGRNEFRQSQRQALLKIKKDLSIQDKERE